jgi:hypothetical protein
MTTGVDDLTSPTGALIAAQDAYREASSCGDDPQRRAQYARSAQDYAATTYWHPESTPRQRQQAQECTRQSYDLIWTRFGSGLGCGSLIWGLLGGRCGCAH